MEYKPLRAIISGGGTGGHIFPAISIANKLKELNPDTEILFVGATGKMEMEKVPAAGYKIVGLPIVGMQRQLNLKNIVNDIQVPFRVLKSVSMAKKLIREFKPDIVIGVGGYASAPRPHPGAERLRRPDEQAPREAGAEDLRRLRGNGTLLPGGPDRDERQPHPQGSFHPANGGDEG